MIRTSYWVSVIINTITLNSNFLRISFLPNLKNSLTKQQRLISSITFCSTKLFFLMLVQFRLNVLPFPLSVLQLLSDSNIYSFWFNLTTWIYTNWFLSINSSYTLCFTEFSFDNKSLRFLKHAKIVFNITCSNFNLSYRSLHHKVLLLMHPVSQNFLTTFQRNRNYQSLSVLSSICCFSFFSLLISLKP
jgi:hypothetical protein